MTTNNFLLASILSGTQNRQYNGVSNPSPANNTSEPVSIPNRQNFMRPLNVAGDRQLGKGGSNSNFSLKPQQLDESQFPSLVTSSVNIPSTTPGDWNDNPSNSTHLKDLHSAASHILSGLSPDINPTPSETKSAVSK